MYFLYSKTFWHNAHSAVHNQCQRAYIFNIQYKKQYEKDSYHKIYIISF